MAKMYDHEQVEKKWQKRWEEAGVFKADDKSSKPKFYGLVEFPYPSGAGMHVGHIKAYSSIEVIARKRRMQGYNVLFPIGFDSFGLPAENYAIKMDRVEYWLNNGAGISETVGSLIRRARKAKPAEAAEA